MQLLEDSIDGEANIFSGGSTCKVGDRLLPQLVTCSPSGGTNGEILVTYLRHIDNRMNQDCTTAPFTLLLDDHNSIFEEHFLSYINLEQESDRNKWTVLLGCPYGTSLWQVGDAWSQNRQYIF